MSCNTNEEVRLIIKYSTIAGAEPTIPLSGDHEDGTWLPTDLYTGELFLNSIDEKLWIRTNNGIVGIGGTAGATFSGIYDYVHISGGTYSGDVYAPTFSAINLIGTNIHGETFEGNIGLSASFIGNFFGDGSGLTGIIADWLGGTVSNPVHFTNRVDFTNDVYIDGIIYTNNPNISLNTDLEISGGVSASVFYGDGSGLTNLPTGTYSDTYTATAELSGNQIIFTRNDLSDYSVDLTPILASQSLSMVQWDDTTDQLTLTLNDGTELGITIDVFNTLNSTGAITAPEFYGGTFYGTFVGDLEGIVGATGPAGATGSAGPAGPTGPAGPSGATLEQTLQAGNDSGAYDIMMGTATTIGTHGGTGRLLLDSLGDGDTVKIDASHGSAYGRVVADGYGEANLLGTDGTYTSILYVNAGGIQASTDTGVGIQYPSDYSATFLQYSLVDKNYVDTYAGGALEKTLALGNTTGTQSIYISSSASQIKGYNGISQHWYDSANPLGPYLATENGIGLSSSFIRLYGRGDTIIQNNRYYDNINSPENETSERATIHVRTDAVSSKGEARDFANNTYWLQTEQTISGYGMLSETRDYINDTSSQVSTSTDGNGTSTYALLQAYHNGGIYTGQIFVRQDKVTIKSEQNGASFTNIELNYTDIIVSGTPSFAGITYDRDYSANYTNRSLVDKSYIDTMNATDITYVALEAAAYVGSLTKGTTYFITDRKIWIKALDTNLLSTSAQRSQQIIKDEAYQMTGTLGVWNSDLAPSIGDKTIWNCELWSNTTGANTQPDYLDDWSLITTDALYYDKIFDIEYDIKYDVINVQSDDRGNILRRSMTSDLICDWGNTNIFSNECSGIYNNSNAFIFGNKITGGIFNNITNSGIQNNIGNIAIENNNCNAVSYNKCPVVNNIASDISNNQCNDSILNNNIGGYSIQYNSNNGTISGNTNTGEIQYNTNNGTISFNSNTGIIAFNSNNGDISSNTNPGGIEQNSNDGVILTNSNDGSIYFNSTGGNIWYNSNIGWIKYNTNALDIQLNTNNGDVGNNSNNGYVSQNSNNGRVEQNSNNGSIGSNSNGGYINSNSNNGGVSNNSNLGVIFLNSNGGGIFNNSNTGSGSISNNTNGSDIAYNTIVGNIQNNNNSGGIQSNTQASGTTNITYNNNNGNISGAARTANITGTIVNI